MSNTTHINLNDLVQLKFTFSYLFFLFNKLKINGFFDDKHGQYTCTCNVNKSFEAYSNLVSYVEPGKILITRYINFLKGVNTHKLPEVTRTQKYMYMNNGDSTLSILA